MAERIYFKWTERDWQDRVDELESELTAATSEVERLKLENERLNRDLSKAKEEMSNSQLHNAFE